MSVKLFQASLAELYHQLPVLVAQNLYCVHYCSLNLLTQTSQSHALLEVQIAIAYPGACRQIVLEV